MGPHLQDSTNQAVNMISNGDLNNVSSMRATDRPLRDPDYAYRALAIPATSEDAQLRQLYRPFLLHDSIQAKDWVSCLELATVTKMSEENFKETGNRLRVLVLYGSLRKR